MSVVMDNTYLGPSRRGGFYGFTMFFFFFFFPFSPRKVSTWLVIQTLRNTVKIYFEGVNLDRGRCAIHLDIAQ